MWHLGPQSQHFLHPSFARAHGLRYTVTVYVLSAASGLALSSTAGGSCWQKHVNYMEIRSCSTQQIEVTVPRKYAFGRCQSGWSAGQIENFHRFNVYRPTDSNILTIQAWYCFKASRLGLLCPTFFDADANKAAHQKGPISGAFVWVLDNFAITASYKRGLYWPLHVWLAAFDNWLFWVYTFVYLPAKRQKCPASGCDWSPVQGCKRTRQRSVFFSSTNINLFLFVSGRDIFLHGFNGVAHFRELNYKIYGSYAPQSRAHIR